MIPCLWSQSKETKAGWNSGSSLGVPTSLKDKAKDFIRQNESRRTPAYTEQPGLKRKTKMTITQAGYSWSEESQSQKKRNHGRKGGVLAGKGVSTPPGEWTQTPAVPSEPTGRKVQLHCCWCVDCRASGRKLWWKAGVWWGRAHSGGGEEQGRASNRLLSYLKKKKNFHTFCLHVSMYTACRSQKRGWRNDDSAVRTLIALPECPGSNPRTHTTGLNCLYLQSQEI